MPNGSKKMDGQTMALELTPDFLGESRHEFVARLAYQYWEERGMPSASSNRSQGAAPSAANQ